MLFFPGRQRSTSDQSALSTVWLPKMLMRRLSLPTIAGSQERPSKILSSPRRAVRFATTPHKVYEAPPISRKDVAATWWSKEELGRIKKTARQAASSCRDQGIDERYEAAREMSESTMDNLHLIPEEQWRELVLTNETIDEATRGLENWASPSLKASRGKIITEYHSLVVQEWFKVSSEEMRLRFVAHSRQCRTVARMMGEVDALAVASA